MKIRQKLFLFAFIILTGNVILGYAIFNSNQKLLESEKWLRHTEQVISQSANILSAAKDIENASRGFVITNDSSYLAPLASAKKTVFVDINHLKQLTADNPSQQSRIDSLDVYMHKRLDFSLKTVELRGKQGMAPAIALILTKQGRVYTGHIRQIIQAIQAEEDKLLKLRTQANKRSFTTFDEFTLVMFLLMAGLTVVLLIITGKYLYQNKEKEKRAAELAIANNELLLQNEEKEKHAAELNRINRLYAFLSQVNQNIVHVQEEKALFHDSCNIAIEFGKFKIAWVGLFDNASKTITSVDQMGIPDEDIGHFKNIPLVANGPQENVQNTGDFFICNDIKNDQGLNNWKPMALKYGINSFMIVPIKKSGNVIGSFNLYAEEPDFFKEEEIELLIEVGGDISFALDTLENEKTHKRTEALLVQNEKRYRALIEKGADMVTLSTSEGKLIYGTDSITKGLGYTIEELLHMTVFDIIHPDDIHEVVKNKNKLLKTPGKSFPYQQRRKHKDGSWIWCEGTLTNMLHEPGINALVSNFRDISEKKMMDQQREFEKNNMNALINNTGDLMWSVDRQFNLITSNEPYNKFVKGLYGKEIVKGESVLYAGLDPELLARNKTFYERAFAGEAFTEIIFNGFAEEAWSEVSYHPIRTGNAMIGTACYSRNITEKIKTEQQLNINEKRFRALVENGTDAVAILSPEGNVNYISPSIEKILGYTEEEAKKLNKFSLIYPDDLAAAKKVWEQMLANYGIPIAGITCRTLHKDGSWRWLEATLTNLMDDPAVNGIVDNFKDVTEKKLAEEGLLLTQLALDNAGDAVFWMAPDARIVRVNEAACTMLGYKRKDLVKLSIPDIDPYYNAEKWPFHFAELRYEGSLFFESVQKAKDGRYIPVEIRANYVKMGDAEFNCAFIRDISERKIAEKNMIKSEATLKEAQAIARIGNFEIDLSTRVEVWSDEMYKIFGISREETVVSTALFLSFLCPDDLERVRAGIEQCKKELRGDIFDFRFKRNDGTMRYGYSELRFEFSQNGSPIRIYGIFQDITERKLAEMERTQMVNDLMLRNIELEQFGYIISHNLRAPVANIIGASNALNDPELDAEDKEILSRGINQSVIKLDNVVKDLNHILQVKGEVNDTKEVVHFAELVDDIKASIKYLIEKDDIEIKYDFNEVGELLTLKPYLYSVFYNLISNSIKYRQPQIHTLIKIKSCRLKNNKVALIFSDNGMGINLQKSGSDVFGLYKRFHTNIEGKGMGLFMVKTQVETLGGRISLRSRVNEGAEFRIEFEL